MTKPKSCSGDHSYFQVIVKPGTDLNEPSDGRVLSNPHEEDSGSLHTAIDSDSTSGHTTDNNANAREQTIEKILDFIRPSARRKETVTRDKITMSQFWRHFSTVLFYLLLFSVPLSMAIALCRLAVFDKVVIHSLPPPVSHEESIVPSAEEEEALRKLRPHAALTFDTATRSAKHAADVDLSFQMDRVVERTREALQESQSQRFGIFFLAFFLLIVSCSSVRFFWAPHLFARAINATSCSSDDRDIVSPGSDLNKPIDTRFVFNEHESAPRHSKWIVAMNKIPHFILTFEFLRTVTSWLSVHSSQLWNSWNLTRRKKTATRDKTATHDKIATLQFWRVSAVLLYWAVLFYLLLLSFCSPPVSHEESIVPSAEALTFDTAIRSAELAANEDVTFPEKLKLKRVPPHPEQLEKMPFFEVHEEMDRIIERTRKTMQVSEIFVDRVWIFAFFLFILTSSVGLFLSTYNLFA